MTDRLWNAVSAYFKKRHGRPVQKIPLDSDANCPNRDGTLSFSGCAFCNANGAGSGLRAKGLSIAEQWLLWREKYGRHRKSAFYLAYFQSFSNTYGPAEKLRRIVEQSLILPDAIGICIGTRPDCLDEEKLDILASCPLPEVWLDLGLQSAHDRTLKLINRGHDRAASENAVCRAAAKNIKVCAHLMAGLPGESTKDFIDSAVWASSLPISGIKLHNLYVARGSTLEKDHAVQNYIPLNKDEYIDSIIEVLTIMPPHVTIHRLSADPAPGELIAPAWAAEKNALLNQVYHTMARRGLFQGCQL